MRMLVSVRSVDEALVAAAGGADFIDLKEPRDGALGALPLATVGAIVQALRAARADAFISATIGDGPWSPTDAAARVAALAGCGVDYVKVGVTRTDAAVLDALAASPHAVVPVFIADHGLEAARIAQAQRGPFPALMLDTADKAAGSLFDCVATADLRRFVADVRAAGKFAGLAGALRQHHLGRLAELAPDFAGFRSAVCQGSREGALDAGLLAALRSAFTGVPAGVPAVAHRGAARPVEDSASDASNG